MLSSSRASTKHKLLVGPQPGALEIFSFRECTKCLVWSQGGHVARNKLTDR